MEAIYYDSIKVMPSSTTFEDVLNIPNVIILPDLRTSHKRAVNDASMTRTTIQMIGHEHEEDLLTILFNQEQKHRKEAKKSIEVVHEEI